MITRAREAASFTNGGLGLGEERKAFDSRHSVRGCPVGPRFAPRRTGSTNRVPSARPCDTGGAANKALAKARAVKGVAKTSERMVMCIAVKNEVGYPIGRAAAGWQQRHAHYDDAKGGGANLVSAGNGKGSQDALNAIQTGGERRERQ